MEAEPTAEAPLVCAECGRGPREDENEAADPSGLCHPIGVYTDADC